MFNQIKNNILFWILVFFLTILIAFISEFFMLNGSILKWGFNALIFGFSLILLSIYIIFFKIILMEKFDIINPGGRDLQITCFILAISGAIIIIFSSLNLMQIIP